MTGSLRYYAVGEILFFQFMPLYWEIFSIQITKTFHAPLSMNVLSSFGGGGLFQFNSIFSSNIA